MLLIGDVHITSRVKDDILDTLRTFIANHPTEQHIIFVGDYVYHFAYDRAALSSLYAFFIELFTQGKTVYVLAGNHDWLTDSFVYDEAKKAFDLLHGSRDNKLYFITEPMECTIEGQQILFLPYMLETKSLQTNDIVDIDIAWKTDLAVLLQSTNKNEQMSGLLTRRVLQSWAQNNNILVIFHHYLANTRLPGQKSLFHYKDVALHPGLLDLSGLRLLSGHVHQMCSYKNYLGIGSVWHTSPLEVQETKGLCCLRDAMVSIQPVLLYPYLQVQNIDGLDSGVIQSLLVDIRHTVQTYFVSSVWSVEFGDLPIIDMKQLSLTIMRDDIVYDALSTLLPAELLESIRDIKIKKNALAIQDLLSDFSTQQRDLQTGFADWKDILKTYIAKKYPEEEDHYLHLLHDMQLL